MKHMPLHIQIKSILSIGLGVNGKSQRGKLYSDDTIEKAVNYSFMEDAIKFDTRLALSKITCPLFVLHGDSDMSVNLNNSTSWINYSTSSRKILEIIQGANHTYDGDKHLEIAVQKTTNWFKETL